MSVLITGGAGSFGRAMTKRLLDDGCERVVVFSRDEVKQADMAREFGDHPALRFFIGDVRDRDRLRRAFSGVELVIHAAALKRIEVGFYNPSEMVKTNIGGAMNVIEAAMDAGVAKVIGLSSDKAFQPVSPYGQSKALAEFLFLAANNTGGRDGPRFAVTRYGNVAGSTGSVIPLWREILKTGDTVPVTDPDCTRFWMTMDEAVDLVIDTSNTMSPLNIPELPAYRLADLAEAMGTRRHLIYDDDDKIIGTSPQPIKFNITGLADWEKKHESMQAGNSSDLARRMTVPELREALQSV